MGVVRPHDDLRLAMEGLQVRGNGQQGIHHVPVAEIPGLDITAQHRAVVVFGIGDDCAGLRAYRGRQEGIYRSPRARYVRKSPHRGGLCQRREKRDGRRF
jgi:hypothetical protein